MLLLALDTSTPYLSIALVDGDRQVLAERTLGPPGSHSRALPLAASELLAACGRSLSDLAGIAVGLGPGSFTGLRVGLATAKGLCYARRIPLVGASSLKAMAHAAMSHRAPETVLVPCLYARTDEVYAGFYRAGDLEPVAAEAALSPLELARRLAAAEGPMLLFGLGRSQNAAVFGDLAPPPEGTAPTPPARSIAALAGPPGAYDAARLFALEPHYVRPSEAEVRFPHGLPPGRVKPARQAVRRRPGGGHPSPRPPSLKGRGRS